MLWSLAFEAPKLDRFEPSLPGALVEQQKKLGAQSLRKQKKDYGPIVSKDEHGKKCFDEMLKNEKEFSGEWVASGLLDRVLDPARRSSTTVIRALRSFMRCRQPWRGGHGGHVSRL